MNAFPFAIVGFDLDGTLVDSNLDLAPAVNHALRLAGRPEVPVSEVRYLIGGGARRMLERALERTGGPLDPEHFEHVAAELLIHYEANIATNTVPFEGCLAALDDLAARGVKLAVCTNKLELLARKLIDELGMTDRFACILGGDSLGPGRAKPAPDMLHEAARLAGGGRFAMIGDSSFDTLAAKAARAPVVALSFGYNDMPVHDLGADAVIDHYDELIGALERL
ncbi:MAG: HAD family hydrolase [Croceibacterium sp.]